MSPVSISTMRAYLSKSLASNRANGVLNQNKVNGLLAEVDFRDHLKGLGYAERISLGGWIARRVGAGKFGLDTVAAFPEVRSDNSSLIAGRSLTEPGRGLHTICSTFYQIGIKSFFCSLRIPDETRPDTFSWESVRLGTPIDEPWTQLNAALHPHLTGRNRRYNFLSYNTDVSRIPDAVITEEFLKEHLRVTIQTAFLAEVSDIDGILWGKEKTYPIEIKEKTAACDDKLGEFFGLDVGPFVKLAFYASKRGNLHSIFVVREIEDTTSRALKNWWFITFDRMAQFASWNPLAGGTNMRGGGSTVIKIPKSEFSPLNKFELDRL